MQLVARIKQQEQDYFLCYQQVLMYQAKHLVGFQFYLGFL
jgi:hypothetical protein